jgi:hypothetical protein
MQNSIVRNVFGFFAAVIAAYVLGAIFISQGNIASIIALDFDVSVAQRFEAALHDVTHMTNIYLPVIAVSYFVSMLSCHSPHNEDGAWADWYCSHSHFCRVACAGYCRWSRWLPIP